MFKLWDQFLIQEEPDARVEKFLFMKNSLPTTIILFGWLLFATVLGWRMMYRCKAFSLGCVIMLVNATQVIFHAHIARELWSAGWYKYYGPCVVCDKTNNPELMRMVRACHLFYLMKIFDLLDTVIFILRRKPNRVTKTHIFQRATMLIQAYLITKYAPGGVGTFRLLLDCVVHVITYMYYFFSSIDSLLCRRIVWWKYWLTRSQILRGLLQFFHDFITLSEGCVYPIAITLISLITSFVSVILYTKIYIEHYFTRDLTIFKKRRRQNQLNLFN